MGEGLDTELAWTKRKMIRCLASFQHRMRVAKEHCCCRLRVGKIAFNLNYLRIADDTWQSNPAPLSSLWLCIYCSSIIFDMQLPRIHRSFPNPHSVHTVSLILVLACDEAKKERNSVRKPVVSHLTSVQHRSLSTNLVRAKSAYHAVVSQQIITALNEPRRKIYKRFDSYNYAQSLCFVGSCSLQPSSCKPQHIAIRSTTVNLTDVAVQFILVLKRLGAVSE